MNENRQEVASVNISDFFVFRIGGYTLRLMFSQATDAGKFECQVSTNPKISKTFSLTVVGKSEST